jgi:hypothetical protein
MRGVANWRTDNRSLLAECGIPDAIANSDHRWNYILLHGDDALQTGWNPSWVTPRQAARLLEALEQVIPSQAGHDLIRELRRRAADPPA